MREERQSAGDRDPLIPGPRDGALAASQHGVVSRRQLLDAGLSSTVVRDRLRGGRLIRLHRGVYAVGHRQLRREGHWMAAVLAAGPGAALSHRAAAALHGIGTSAGARIDVTAPERRRLESVRAHRAILHADDVTIVDAVPTTTVARTLLDLAGTHAPERLRKALNEAERLHLLDVTEVQRAIERTKGRRGPSHTALTTALAELANHGTSHTRSTLEDAFLQLLRRAALPSPEANAYIEGMEVDALWRSERLVVELDGYANHHTRGAFQHDRERDAKLLLTGYRVLRFTHHDVTRRSGYVVRTLREALASAPHATMSTACP
jgi:very-short-patch-repair endonuclease